MSIQIKFRGGTAAEHTGFVGAQREITVDTTNNTLRIHDGSTAGGTRLAKFTDLSAASGGATTETGETTPASCSAEELGDFFYNTTSKKIFVCNGSVYEEVKAAAGVTIGDTTPASCSVAGDLFFNEVEEKLFVCDGTNLRLAVPDSAQIEAESLTISAFASSIRPVEIFGSLPTTGNTVGRMVFLTSDNKLYRFTGSEFVTAVPTADLTGTISAAQISAGAVTADKLAANSVVAGKIAAAAISATEIAAGAINADKLAAGSVLAGKIATNAVTSDKIIANAIISGKIATAAVTSAKIAAGSITSDKIGAGEVTAEKLSSGTATIASGRTFSLGQGASIAGLQAVGAFSSSNSDVFSLLSSSTAASALAAGTTVSAAFAGGFFNATSSAFSSFRTIAEMAYGDRAGTFTNVTSGRSITLATANFAFETSGGASGTFTGGHDGLVPKNNLQPVVGDILVDVTSYASPNVYDTICINAVSSVSNQKGVIGVLAQFATDDHVPTAISKTTVGEGGRVSVVIDSIYTDINDYNKIIINGLGEGLMNVCGQNGNIEVGDLIVSSSIAGKGMKQQDDAVRSYTVARARESLSFNSVTEVKQISCIYLCG